MAASRLSRLPSYSRTLRAELRNLPRIRTRWGWPPDVEGVMRRVIATRPIVIGRDVVGIPAIVGLRKGALSRVIRAVQADADNLAGIRK